MKPKTHKNSIEWKEFDSKIAELLKNYFLIKLGVKDLRLAKKLWRQGYTPEEASGLIVLNH